MSEHPIRQAIDFRDDCEVESCLTFAIACACFVGMALNLLVAYAN